MLWCIKLSRFVKWDTIGSQVFVTRYRFSADGGSPPPASQRSPRAPSPQRLPTSRLVAHHPTGLGNPGSPVKYISGFISISISHSVKRSQKPMNMNTTNVYKNWNSPMNKYTQHSIGKLLWHYILFKGRPAWLVRPLGSDTGVFFVMSSLSLLKTIPLNISLTNIFNPISLWSRLWKWLRANLHVNRKGHQIFTSRLC
jgi:hypothetical protein